MDSKPWVTLRQRTQDLGIEIARKLFSGVAHKLYLDVAPWSDRMGERQISPPWLRASQNCP